jgi:hypothetical protein
MDSFTTRPDSFKEVRRMILRRTIPFTVVFILIMIVVDIVYLDPTGWIDTAIVVACVTAMMTGFGFKTQKRMFESFRLTITEDQLIREQLYTPQIAISKSDVQQIVKGKDGSFAIISDSKLNAILVPAQIDRHEELEQTLSQIKPILVKPSSWPQYVQVPLLLAGMAILGCGLLFEDNFIFTGAALGMCAFLVYSFILTQRSRNIDVRLKRLSYAVFLPVLSILAVTVMKWMGTW